MRPGCRRWCRCATPECSNPSSRSSRFADRHDVGPGAHAGDRVQRPGVRRRPPLELRRLRDTRASPHVRRQRLRRDAARSVGVGRQATGGELRGRGPRHRASATSNATRPRSAALAYASEMARLTDLTTLEIHYAHTDVDEAALTTTDVDQATELRTLAATSRTHTSVQAYTKLTHVVDGSAGSSNNRRSSSASTNDSAFGDAGGRVLRAVLRVVAATIAASSSSSTSSAMLPRRSWASAASEPGASSSCSKAAARSIRCSSR